MEFKKIFEVNFLFLKVSEPASPKTKVQVVELVGANSSGQASISFGISNTNLDFFAKVLFPSLVIEIIGTPNFLQCKIMLYNS